MKILDYVVIVVLIVFMSQAFTYSEVFKLKSGDKIEGELIQEDEDSIVLKIEYGQIKINKTELAVPLQTKSVTPEPKPAPTKETLPEATIVIKENVYEGITKWLDSQVDPKTDLLESYRPTSDVCLRDQAATYDQALAGLAFLLLGEKKKARAILDFYNDKWEGECFCNFYFTPTGGSGLESTTHLGPNMWIAILALHYDRITKGNRYNKLVENIVRWAMKLPHYKGGAVMSSKDEWRAQWTKVVSTENNIDYYTVLNILGNNTTDSKLRQEIKIEKDRIIDFIRNTAYDKETGGVFRGFAKGVIDDQYALDTITWLVAATGLRDLVLWDINPQRLMDFTEERFLVTDNGIKGFDFTDGKGAVMANRTRMISVEWTFGMINMYCIYRDYYYELAKEQKEQRKSKRTIEKTLLKANMYDNKSKFYLNEMDKTMVKYGIRKDLYAYPYATRSYWLVFHDSTWWKTPKSGKNDVPAGSVASTAWRVFADRFNPLNANGKFWK